MPVTLKNGNFFLITFLDWNRRGLLHRRGYRNWYFFFLNDTVLLFL